MMGEKRETISLFLSYVLGIVWSIALVICLAGNLRISIIALAGALLLTGVILPTIKRIGGRIYYIRFFALVVVLVVLAVPVVPGLGHSTTLARVSRAQSEMRDLASVLESYKVDFNAYPPACDDTGRTVLPNAFGVSVGYLPLIPTAPERHAPATPLDPFSQKRVAGKTVKEPYRYATNGSTFWIVTSVGPDGREDIRMEDFRVPQKTDCDVTEFLRLSGIGIDVMYDVTNGATSTGDIVRFGP